VDYAAFCAEPVSGLRIGLARTTSWGSHAAVDALAEAAVSALSGLGAVIVDDANLPSAPELDDAEDEMTVLKHEFKVGIADYLATRPDGSPRSLGDLIDFNRAHADVELVHFGQEIFEAALETDGLEVPAYLAARDRCRRRGRQEGIDAALHRHELVALLAPAYPPAWRIDLEGGDPEEVASASTAPALAGYPVLTVPIGLVEGLPVGLAVFGTAWSEQTLIRIAAAIERALGPLPPPPLGEVRRLEGA
jgi:amidase